MNRRYGWIALGLMMVLGAAGVMTVKAQDHADPKTADTVLGFASEWSGEWGPYNPAKELALKKEHCKLIECRLVNEDGKWKATFWGECGQPYKYEITMEGRKVGDSLLFKGTVDLGPADGGEYDWVGRAKGNEFIGYYTSDHSTGLFHMTPGPITSEKVEAMEKKQ